MKIFAMPKPKDINTALSENAFQTPDRKHGLNHWKIFDEFDPRALSEMTEWAFIVVFGHAYAIDEKGVQESDGNFTVKVSAYG